MMINLPKTLVMGISGETQTNWLLLRLARRILCPRPCAVGCLSAREPAVVMGRVLRGPRLGADPSASPLPYAAPFP